MITMRRLSQEPRSHFDAFHPTELERGVGTETEANSLYLGLTRWSEQILGVHRKGILPQSLGTDTQNPIPFEMETVAGQVGQSWGCEGAA